MSAETLIRPHDQVSEQMETITNIDTTAKLIGLTAFEALAEDASTSNEREESETVMPFTNSVTRLGDGQTVPDER